MSKPRIAIILSTTREVRFGHKMGQWILDIAKKRADADFELVDLRDYAMPFFAEMASNAWVPTKDPEGVKWQKTVAKFDGYIFVTAEYNRSIPAVLKNALDYAYPEWNRKAAAYVGYGSVGGARAVEHLRNISVELQLAPTRTGVHLQGGDFMAAWQGGKPISDFGYLVPNAETMLDELVWWTSALKAARDATAAKA